MSGQSGSPLSAGETQRVQKEIDRAEREIRALLDNMDFGPISFPKGKSETGLMTSAALQVTSNLVIEYIMKAPLSARSALQESIFASIAYQVMLRSLLEAREAGRG